VRRIQQFSRREFLASTALLPVLTCLPVRARQAGEETRHEPPYLSLQKFIEPGFDEFPEERTAMEIRGSLHKALETLELPLGPGAKGASPCPREYRTLAPDLQEAVFDGTDGQIHAGWKKWVQSLGSVRRAQFYPLPDGMVRYEVASESDGKLLYRVGLWKQNWDRGQLTVFSPMEEHLASAAQPHFHDVTAAAFGKVASFHEQLARGVPYWRARLDPATGIDIYGSNGIAVGDIDNDGVDEVYVCQPGGLPNRLYKFGAGGAVSDITEQWGAGILDDTSSVLFVDLRNVGRQDLVVLRSGGPVLFLNDGSRFTQRTDAFRFANLPKGGFTGMAAADFDRDGKLDLYLCCYVYFQSEAQYTYASPYHDAQNGPPNFLFRNRLNADGSGFFEDCTEETGMNENNNRFSFAPAWCDFNEDGWPDLYVANDFGRKNLYVNHQGRFRDLAQAAGVEDIGPGMSASWFDYDGDGKADLYVANMWSDAGQRVVGNQHFAPAQGQVGQEAYRRHTRGNSLYRNCGNGKFEDVTFAQHAQFGRWAWASGGHDLDNDGHPELFVTCGMLTNKSSTDLMGFFWRQVVAKSPTTAQASSAYQNGWNAINQFIREDYSWSGREPNVLHVRRGDRYFDFSGVSGLDFAEDSRAFSICDFDGDGRPDIILKSRLGPQVRILQNNCAGNHQAIAFHLQGTKSNRDAIGARVRVDGQTKWLHAGSGFLSQGSKRMIFGLGQARSVKHLQITWPSGVVQEFGDLPAGKTYFVTEGSAELKSQNFWSHASLPFQAVKADNSLTLHDTWFAEPLPLPDPQRGPGLLLLLHGENVPKLPGVTTNVVHFARGSEDQRRQWEVFRRYLFDWRASLQTPMAFLLNDSGQAVKVYAAVPDVEQCKADLAKARDHQKRALPFGGDYVVQPHRDFFKLGAAFLWSGYPAQALPYLERVLQRTAENARVLVLVGQIYLDKQNFDKAETHLRQALVLDPQSAEANYGLGLALAKQNRLDEARSYFEGAIRSKPDYADAVNDLGALYIQSGKINDAIAAFTYGIRVAPDEDMLYLNLGRTYARLGQFDRARQVMQQLLDRKPDSTIAQHALQELSNR
jgi:tetratricopeptide (TPR) repeat protein